MAGSRPVRLAKIDLQVCRGYRRKEFVFLAEGWRAPGVASQSHPQNGRSQSRRQRAREDRNATVPASTPTPEEPVMIISPSIDGESKECVTLSRSISPDPMQMYVAFFLAQFTTNLPREAYFFQYNCRRSFARLLGRSDASTGIIGPCLGDPLTHASEALVKGYFAKLHGSSQLLQESIRSCSTALKSLSVGLDEVNRIGVPALREPDWIDYIFSCILLAFWEVSNPLRPDLVSFFILFSLAE